MSECLWVRSHVELLLAREWEVGRVEADAEGDWPYRDGTAACWVSVVGDERPMVHVFAHAACGFKSTLKLLRELNEIQNRALTARVALNGDCVIVSQVISPIGLTQPVLAQAVVAVGGVAGSIGTLLAGMFDGHTPYPQSVPDSEDAT